MLLALLLACSDYELSGEESKPGFDSGEEPADSEPVETADTAPVEETDATVDTDPPPEECDGVDNDGDGAVDEGFPDTDLDGTADCRDAEECDDLDNDGDGEVDEGFDLDEDHIPDCDEVDHEVKLTFTADDAWEAWVDGVWVAEGDLWSVAGHADAVLDSGPHVVAVHAWDVYGQPSGFMAAVQVDGVAASVTGDGTWRYSRSDPGVGWEAPDFDSSGFALPDTCTGTWWGSSPAELWSAGARMVWEGDCTGVGQGWFRLELDLP